MKVLPHCILNNSYFFFINIRSNSVTPPATKSIPRSSTYEKIAKQAVNTTNTTKQPQNSSNTVQNMKPRQNQTFVSKPVAKKYQPTTSKPSGGPRIVKPVTPRPKPNAITSKSLKQSNFSPFSEMRSYAISTGSSACISIERTSRNSQDGKVSIPLVTAPFDYGTQESRKDDEEITTNEECTSQINGSPFAKRDSESENSDREDA